MMAKLEVEFYVIYVIVCFRYRACTLHSLGCKLDWKCLGFNYDCSCIHCKSTFSDVPNSCKT